MASSTYMNEKRQEENRARQAKKGNKMTTPAAIRATCACASMEAETTALAEGPVASPIHISSGSPAHLSASTSDLEHRSNPKLAQDLSARIVEVAPTAESIARIHRCLRELSRVTYGFGPGWEVRPFGSFANGFTTSSSDLDVTLLTNGFHYEATTVLGDWFMNTISQSINFEVEEVILSARISLLKLRFEGFLAVDVSCHNPIPLLNTKLLAAYSFADARIQHLGVAAKIWAKGVGVCDASQSNLSSYSFTLMVLYFLQVHSEVNLPQISVTDVQRHPQTFPSDLVDLVSARWQCKLPLADLLTRFFEFYAKDFSWGDEVVSVRCAARLSVSHPAFGTLRGRHAQRLHVEDPFQLERNLHGVLGEREEQQLRRAFGDAHAQISALQTPFPLVPVHSSPIPVRSSRSMQGPMPQQLKTDGLDLLGRTAPSQLKVAARDARICQSTASSDAGGNDYASSDSSSNGNN